MIKWLFFDLGSTLIDETECEEFRIKDLLRQSSILTREILNEKYREYTSKNCSPYKEIIKKYRLKEVEWPTNLEKLYPGVPSILEHLVKKYHLGVIANQRYGTKQRLEQYGIRKYFDIVISSSELGVSKPSLEIFQNALTSAKCNPEEAYMIGDRLDNDIEPAVKLNLHTIWVRQGLFANSNLEIVKLKPEISIDKISEILNYL